MPLVAVEAGAPNHLFSLGNLLVSSISKLKETLGAKMKSPVWRVAAVLGFPFLVITLCVMLSLLPFAAIAFGALYIVLFSPSTFILHLRQALPVAMSQLVHYLSAAIDSVSAALRSTQQKNGNEPSFITFFLLQLQRFAQLLQFLFVSATQKQVNSQ